jgi:hypothetical protein
MAKRIKLPKRIAGIKIPKSVRKGLLGEYIRSAPGQLLIAEALLLAGETLGDSASPGGNRSAMKVPDRLNASGGRFADDDVVKGIGAGDDAGSRFSKALTAALGAFRATLNDVAETDGVRTGEELSAPRQ